MHISNTGISGQASTANFSGNNPLPFKQNQSNQLPKQPNFNLPGKTTTAGSSGVNMTGPAPSNDP